jgi:chromosome segregation ATPase
VSPHGPALSKEVHTLTAVIKQLEEQLEQMVATNAALRKDYQDERARRLALEEKVEQLNEALRRSERQGADKENLLAEVKHANQERARLNASTRELGERLKELVQQQETETKKVERLRAAHADALEEVQSVEAQFERAMQVVAQTRAQLAIASEERDQHSLRARNNEVLLKELRQERDALVAEVEQSRAALDEIRQSLVDVCSPGEEPNGRGSASPVGAKGQT